MTSAVDAAEAIRAYNEGVRAIQEGDSDSAYASWQRAIELDPGMIPAMRNLVVYYEERDRTADVIQTYGAMLAFDPFDTESLIRQASAYRRTGAPQMAISNYERAIAIYPYFRFWYDELAMLLDQVGSTDQGEVWRSRAKELDADEAEMAFEDGVRQQRTGNNDLAIAIFEAVLEDQPANLEARVRLANILHGLGRTADAVDQLTQAFELTDSAPALVLYHRARIRSEAGEVDAAVTDLRAALDAQPVFGLARRLLERLTGEPASSPAVPAMGVSVSGAASTEESAVQSTSPGGAPRPSESSSGADPATAPASSDPPVAPEPRDASASASVEFEVEEPVSEGTAPLLEFEADVFPTGHIEEPTDVAPEPRAESSTDGGTAPILEFHVEPGRVREHSQMSGPILPLPSTDAPWLEQLRFVVERASALSSRTGQTGRIAVFLEADTRLVPLANAVLQLVAAPELGLYSAEHSRVYFIEGESAPGAGQHGLAGEGWFGTQFFEPGYDQWGPASPGIPVDRMLEAAQLAVGSDGFNLLLVVTTGHVRPDQAATSSFMRHVPTYQVAILTLPDAGTELAERLGGLVPNLVTVVAHDHH